MHRRARYRQAPAWDQADRRRSIGEKPVHEVIDVGHADAELAAGRPGVAVDGAQQSQDTNSRRCFTVNPVLSRTAVLPTEAACLAIRSPTTMRLTVVRVNPPTKPPDGEQVTPCRASIARMVGQVVPSALAVIRRVIRGLAQSRCRATQGTPISRASSRFSLARPNICRFTSFRWVICPSVWPFDQGSVSAAATAALSFRRPPAKDGRRLRAAASIQTSRSGRLHSRITAWKRDSRTRASSSNWTCASIVATSMASAFAWLSPGRHQLGDNAR